MSVDIASIRVGDAVEYQGHVLVRVDGRYKMTAEEVSLARGFVAKIWDHWNQGEEFHTGLSIVAFPWEIQADGFPLKNEVIIRASLVRAILSRAEDADL